LPDDSRERSHMAIYQSMQRVRFSSADDYEKFKIVISASKYLI